MEGATAVTLPTWANGPLLTFMRCQEQFRRRYVEHEDTPATVRMRRGSALAWVARETHLRQKRAKDAAATSDVAQALRASIPTRAEAQDLAATEYDRLIRDHGVTLSDDERAIGEARVVGDEKQHVVDSASYYVLRVAPGVNPIAVEREIIVEPRGFGIRIRGTLDLVDQRTEPDGRVLEGIRDLKTSSKSPARDEADRSDQLSLYAMLRLAETGRYPDFNQLDYIVRTPAYGQVKHVALRTERDDRDTNAILAKLEIAVESTSRGVYMPNTTGWHCAPKWCPYFNSCRFVSDRRKS